MIYAIAIIMGHHLLVMVITLKNVYGKQKLIKMFGGFQQILLGIRKTTTTDEAKDEIIF